MKKKFLVLTLCFTLIFSSLNYKKSYAAGGVISLPMLAAVSTLAVGCGMVLSDVEDIYDIGYIFYESNKDIWNNVVTVFNSSVAFNKTLGKLSIDKPFLDIFKNTFSDYADDGNGYYNAYRSLSSLNGLNINELTSDYRLDIAPGVFIRVNKPAIYDGRIRYNIGFYKPSNYINSSASLADIKGTALPSYPVYLRVKGSKIYCDGAPEWAYFNSNYDIVEEFKKVGLDISLLDSVSIPYSPGYDDSVLNDNEDIYVPGNLGDLVGGNVGDIFGDVPFPGVSNGDISLPGISNPSIDVDNSISFPVVDSPVVDSPSVPNEGIWSTIKDFIIGLVVPSDTYWTDTWGGLYNNFTNSFPMVDMDGFNDLVTGEKKFPNIDINIMGVTGRVVNGDVINSIVDWLRPIIAGFMMLCLMLFNYRKIYKLIRNTEPFGGIAPGTSDFSTGISEYSKQEVVKATDMVAEYRAWKERGGK